MTENSDTYDYVIVGAGSAGCVLANRLSADPDTRVCLLEAGKKRSSWASKIPLGIIATMRMPQVNWRFRTEPQPGLNGRRGYQPRGRMLGGSSAINAMIYIRGHPSDYDDWAARGNPGWAWSDVLPIFKSFENNRHINGPLHGTDGELEVANLRSPNAASQTFLEAGRELQIPVNPDFNGPDQEGVGLYQVTQKHGLRHSAADAFLTPIAHRKNLDIRTGAHVARVTLDGRRATGVELRDGSNLSAKREVILSAGAFQSPQILLLSGIGPASHLADHGIEPRCDLPAVGEHLQDHLDFIVSHQSPSIDTFGLSLRGTGSLIKATSQLITSRRGMLTSNIAEAGGFLKSEPDLDRPDLQLHFCIGWVDDHGRKLHFGHGYSCHVCVLRPKSRGTVRLSSPRPDASPAINPNYLADPDDLDLLLKGVKRTRQILAAPAFKSIRGAEKPDLDGLDDAAIAEIIRQRADTIYHPVGTCRMGPDPRVDVVDHNLNVHGVERLRVADCSIMPTLIGGNTNAPAMMIAEKAAAAIRKPETPASRAM